MAQLTVQDVMTRNPVSIAPDLKVDIGLQLMRERGIRRLPVVSSADRLIGIITLDDAAQAMPRGSTFFSEGPLEDIPTVRDVMTHDVQTVRPDDPVVRAARIMLTHKIGALPVVAEYQLVGIVTESDLFETQVGMLESA